MSRPGRASTAKAKDNLNQLIEMGRAGWSDDEIAVKLDYKSAAVVRELRRRAINARTDEAVEDVRKREIDRLDALLTMLWERMPDENGDQELMLKFQAQVNKLQERRAKYLGLDAPTKVDTKVDLSDQLQTALEAVTAYRGALTPPEPQEAEESQED